MNLLIEGLAGGFRSIVNIAVICVPIMVALQLAKDYRLMERGDRVFSPVTRWMGLSRESTLPLLVGIVFGLSFGGGALVHASREGELSKRDMTLVVLFLVACHAIFEDTLVFVAVGANGWLLFSVRIVFALVMTRILSRRLAGLNLTGQE